MRMAEFYNLPDFNPTRLTEAKNKHFVQTLCKVNETKVYLILATHIQYPKKLEFYNTFMLHATYVKTIIVGKELLWVSSVCWDK